MVLICFCLPFGGFGAKLETNVQLYNMIQSGGDPFKIQNLKALMGGENPTEKLTKLNNYGLINYYNI